MISRLAVVCWIGSGFSLCALCASAGEPVDPPAPQIEFNRDIRPLLSDNCYQCHGPDAAKRQADLRLDREDGAKADLGGRAAVVPGKPVESELLLRLTTDDPAERMPPPKTGRTMTPAQVDLVRRWIEQGARWQNHWAFIPPARPALPTVQHRDWARNPVDAFVLARLEREGLAPAPEADRATLLRRVSFDLTGLPPAPAEVDAFLADSSPDAYEKVVDRLLSSPRFGERMASRWLDGARYADTNGYQTDAERHMWRWRDWVIEAFNANMPFDRFTVEQLAGDLLPGATLDQQIASGFNRNHRGNGEGGIIAEEYAVEYVVDRVETTYTVWMGLTMGCSRCHDHKFDPLTQKDFYRSFAYFNNIPESGHANKYGNSPPMIKAPTAEQRRELRSLDARLAEAERRFDRHAPAIATGQTKWESEIDRTALADFSVSRGLQSRFRFDEAAPVTQGESAPKWEAGEPAYGAGRTSRAAEFDGTRFLNAGDVGKFGFYDRFTLSAWINPANENAGTVLSRMLDEEEATGYSLLVSGGHLQCNLVLRWLDDALRVESVRSFRPGEWHHVSVSYDGSRTARGVKLYVDGVSESWRVVLDELNQSFASKEPFRIGGGNGPANRFRGRIDDVRIYDRVLDETDAAIVAVPEPIGELAAIPAAGRSPAQSAKLRLCFLERGAADDVRRDREQLESLRRERDGLIDGFSTAMVMQEMSTPRETFVLTRGEYNKPGEKVTRATPGCLPTMSDGTAQDRLAFARWLVDGNHPLTARVAVNRMWQMLFGTGLVKTVDDFGAQGEWPTHPELLDWLAVEFATPVTKSSPPLSKGGQGGAATRAIGGAVAGRAPPPNSPFLGGGERQGSAWDTKRLLRLLVTSSTYRQSSRVTPELASRDPENRLLSRGPRLRLSAEMVRDQALHASGMLVERQGGPSVKPYQPAGLWKELNDSEYVQDKGENLYRRSLYTFWKRTVAPPTMITFDAAGRETCVVRETRTNTPLQALTLMNDVTFVEASRALAQRVVQSPAANTPEERLELAFRLALSRPPTASELTVLVSGWRTQRERFAGNREAAEKLLAQGEWPRDAALDVVDLAAYAVTAGIVLNLDETITKE